MGLFGKPPDPREQVREWQSRLRKEDRTLDRQIWQIQREEDKIKRSLKEAAKKGDKATCLVLAKEVARSRKAVQKIYTAKAQIKSVGLNMTNQLATLRITGAMEKSAEVMKSMSQLVKVEEVAATMRDMSKEMMKAGIIEEMIDDTLGELDNSEDIEDAAEEEVDKVLFELTAGQLGKAPDAVRDSLPVPAGSTRITSKQPAAAAALAAEGADDDDDVEDMQARLAALRS